MGHGRSLGRSWGPGGNTWHAFLLLSLSLPRQSQGLGGQGLRMPQLCSVARHSLQRYAGFGEEKLGSAIEEGFSSSRTADRVRKQPHSLRVLSTHTTPFPILSPAPHAQANPQAQCPRTAALPLQSHGGHESPQWNFCTAHCLCACRGRRAQDNGVHPATQNGTGL